MRAIALRPNPSQLPNLLINHRTKPLLTLRGTAVTDLSAQPAVEAEVPVLAVAPAAAEDEPVADARGLFAESQTNRKPLHLPRTLGHRMNAHPNMKSHQPQIKDVRTTGLAGKSDHLLSAMPKRSSSLQRCSTTSSPRWASWPRLMCVTIPRTARWSSRSRVRTPDY